MKFRKIYLLYIATLLPGFMMVGALLMLNHDIYLINHLAQPLGTQTNQILQTQFSITIRNLYEVLVKYYVLLLAISAAALCIRFFRTRSGWKIIAVHILLSIFLGFLLSSFSFAIAEVVGRFFGWSFFAPVP